MKRLNQVLNIIISCCFGVFVGHAVYVYLDYKKHADLYAMQSAPWYTSILAYGIFTLITSAACFIVKLIIRKKLKQ